MTMAGAYDDRDGFIWMDGALVPWRSANVHILTHALHYASSVFEGERCYSGKIFKSREHSARLIESGRLLDMEIPYSVDQIEEAKYAMLKANGWTDAYVRAVAWRGSGEDMGVSARKNPVRLAVAGWEWGAYYGDAKWQGARLDIAKWKRPSPETIPTAAKAAGLYMICTMSKHAAEAKGCSDALFMDYRGYVAEATGANVFFVKDGEVHTPLADAFLNGITRQTIIAMQGHGTDRPRTPHHARGTGQLLGMLADRHRGRGDTRGPDRRLPFPGRRPDAKSVGQLRETGP